MLAKLLIALVLTCALLVACSASTPAPTVTPSPTETLEPTAVSSPTETLISILPLNQPTGTPDKPGDNFNSPLLEWNGIPIIHGAITGTGDNNSYRFIINTSMDNVHTYYSAAMNSLGWKLASSDNQNGAFVYLYIQGTNTVKISISQQASFTVVVLSKGP